MNKLKKFFRFLGPGLITGAADDDPSGIATYSQTGAQFGYGQLWTALFILPLQTAIQEACGRIGAVTGQGIAAVVKKYYGRKLLYFVVGLILIANTINIGADIGAMAAAARLIVPVNFAVLAFIFTAFMLALEIFASYRVYARFLKFLTLSLLAYPLTVLIVHGPWLQIFKATFIPHFELSFAFLFIFTGVLGTTISPYMFFWQASEEVEEERVKHLLRLGKPVINKRFIKTMQLDNFLGMLFSQIGSWSIIVVAAAVLFKNGLTNIATAADAARALEPLVETFPNAGLLAKLIFAAGIIGLGLLSVPVLAGSAAYALAEVFDWNEGLSLKLRQGHGFYGIITVATLVGLAINFIGIDPIRALIYTAVINGLVAVPLIFVIARIASNGKIMGKYKSGRVSRVLVALTFLAMLIAGIAMLWSFTRL